jgi:hypothetical protein
VEVYPLQLTFKCVSKGTTAGASEKFIRSVSRYMTMNELKTFACSLFGRPDDERTRLWDHRRPLDPEPYQELTGDATVDSVNLMTKQEIHLELKTEDGWLYELTESNSHRGEARSHAASGSGSSVFDTCSNYNPNYSGIGYSGSGFGSRSNYGGGSSASNNCSPNYSYSSSTVCAHACAGACLRVCVCVCMCVCVCVLKRQKELLFPIDEICFAAERHSGF